MKNIYITFNYLKLLKNKQTIVTYKILTIHNQLTTNSITNNKFNIKN